MYKFDRKKFGQAVWWFMREEQLSAQRLSKSAGIPLTTLGRVLSGSAIGIEVLFTLADYTGLNLADYMSKTVRQRDYILV